MSPDEKEEDYSLVDIVIDEFGEDNVLVMDLTIEPKENDQ